MLKCFSMAVISNRKVLEEMKKAWSKIGCLFVAGLRKAEVKRTQASMEGGAEKRENKGKKLEGCLCRGG